MSGTAVQAPRIGGFDHVNIRTARLAAMVDFYGRILDMTSGRRPPFPFGGAWLYCGEDPVVHLVEVEAHPATEAPRIEHFAFSCQGLAGFLARLRDSGVAYRIGVLPDWGIRQVNFHDPDGNHIHCDFGPEEEADLSPFPG